MATGSDRKVQVIGVTGGIGSGKSTLSRFLASHLCCPLIDIDLICRKLLAKGEPGWHALRQHLEPAFFSADGSLERGYLRSVLFRDPGLRKSVNTLIHPLALHDMQARIAAVGESAVLVDVPLLYEAGWGAYFSRVIVVYADWTACCRRIAVRDAISHQEAALSIAVQMHLAEKVMLADHVIDNSGCRLFARVQSFHLSALLRNELGGF